MKKLFDKIFLKFILVGVINTLVGTGVMFACYDLLHLGYWFSSAANYIVGSIVSYFLNKYYTFKVRERSFKTVIKFAVNIVVCYFAAYGAAKPLAVYLLEGVPVSVQENVAMLVGVIFFVVLNYFGQRFFAFKKTSDNE